MADFYQTGVVATLHRLGKEDPRGIERELEALKTVRPLALVLPALASELEGDAFARIMDELRHVRYVTEIVLTMGGTNEPAFRKAKALMAGLPIPTSIVWNNGPRIGALYRELEQRGIAAGDDGKGRSVWMACGYVLARGRSKVIALHDCDIVTYDRELLARLVYPVMNVKLDYEFSKGYYARVTNKMHGRVTRLFVTPFLRALRRILGRNDYLEYMDSFRYILSGEFCMNADLARINRIPGDWGLEVGTLGELFRNCAVKRICQVDIADAYEHKHQDLSPGDSTRGLQKMATDIAKNILRTLASEGTVVDAGLLKTLQATYLRVAQDTIKRYADDAAINGLAFDRHQEGKAMETFSLALTRASEQFLEDPLGDPTIPNWNRVLAAIPDFFERLSAAVEADAKD